MGMKKKKPKKRKPRRLREPIERHLGIALDGVECISHEITPTQQVNLQRVIDRWVGEGESRAQVYGYSGEGYFRDDELVKHLITDELIQAPVERAEKESGPDESLDCVQRGLFLLRHKDVPVIVILRRGRYS